MSGQSAPKPKNFDALAAAWADPQRWVGEVAAYNRQLEIEAPEVEPAPLEPGRQHSAHIRERLQRLTREQERS